MKGKTKFISRGLRVLLAAVLVALPVFAAGCGEETPDESGLVELIFDDTFSHGFKLQGNDFGQDVTVKHVLDYDGTAPAGQSPLWTIAQWNSKYDLGEGEYSVLADGTKQYQDPAKTLRVNNETGALGLDYRSDADYDEPRTSGVNWPGILLQHTVIEKARPAELEHLYVKFNFTINSCVNLMGEDYDPGLHSAQLQWMFMIANDNKLTATKDYFWFGVSMFDYRYEIMDEYISQDSAGVDTSTNKFTYNFPQGNWLKEPIQLKKKYEVYYDVLPDIRHGFDLAKAAKPNGTSSVFLDGAIWENMFVQGFNIGWEMPGTFQASVDFDFVHLLAEFKD